MQFVDKKQPSKDKIMEFCVTAFLNSMIGTILWDNYWKGCNLCCCCSAMLQ